MHLFFIDESGTIVAENKKHSKYFVIGGVIIPEIHWHDIYRKLRELKKQYGVTSEIKWRFFSPNNKDNDNGMSNLTFEERDEFRQKLYELITSYKSIKIISTITDIEEAYKLPYVNDRDDLYWYSYKQTVERFQYYLQDLSRNSGAEFNGLVIIDNRLSCDDNRLRNLHHNLLVVDKENYSKFKNLIEGLFIAPSHLSVGIQLADIVAGAIFRKVEKDDSKYYEQIKKSIRNRDGNIFGYGIVQFPKKI